MTATGVVAIAPEHVDDVAAIHKSSFDDPWDSDMVRRVLAMPGAFGLVALDANTGSAVGFALCRSVADECELLSLGVDARFRRRGIGRQLLRSAMARALVGGAGKFFLEVAESNHGARALYAHDGLAQVGRRPGYYELKGGGSEAALTMRADLSEIARRTRDTG